MTPQRKKEIGIVSFVLFYSLLIFALATMFLRQGRGEQVAVIIVLLCLAALWVAFVSLALAAISHPGSAAAVTLGIPITLVVAALFSIPSLVAAVVLGLLLTIARRTIRSEIVNRVVYKTTHIFRSGVRLVLIALLAVVVALAWPLLAQRLGSFTPRLSPEQIEALVGPIVPVQASLPLVTDMVNQYLKSLIPNNPYLLAAVVIIAVFLAFRALIPFIAWPILGLIALIVKLARLAGLLYISRSQATIERLHI